LDIFGTLMIFIAHFGWGKPVPFNIHNLSHPKRDAALIAAAGPVANLITAFAIAVPYKYLLLNKITILHPEFTLFILSSLEAIFTLSLVLCVFNLFPIAPLDGSKFIGIFIPRHYEEAYERYLGRGPMILVLLIVGDMFLESTLGISLFRPLIGFLFGWLRNIILLIV
jgi:Zn-dependent protease